MTTSDAHALISVRGESQSIVQPDQARIYSTVVAVGDTKRASSSEAARTLAAVIAQLAELGGETLSALTATVAPLPSTMDR